MCEIVCACAFAFTHPHLACWAWWWCWSRTSVRQMNGDLTDDMIRLMKQVVGKYRDMRPLIMKPLLLQSIQTATGVLLTPDANNR